MVCNGPYWCPVDDMLRKGHGTWSKRTKTGLGQVTYRHYLRDYLNCPYFYLSQFEHIFGFALSAYFNAQIIPFGEQKSHDMYLCSYSDFSVALRPCCR